MVQFNSVFQINNKTILSMKNNQYEVIIKQPILSYIFYYNEFSKRAAELNTVLWDKLIKRKTAMKAVDFIGESYYNEKIVKENDVILLFSLFQVADSYKYINETGYYYILTNKDSITNTWIFLKKENSIIHGIFINIKFIYEKAHNNHLGKSIAFYKLQQAFERYYNCILKAKKEYSFVTSVLELLLFSPYIYNGDKKIISKLFLNKLN